MQAVNCIVTSFHNYTSMFNHKYFDVLLDYYIDNLRKWDDEVDKVYLLDSGWGIKTDHPKVEVVESDPNKRYYEAYKWILPQIKDDKVLFLDNDMVIWKKGVVKNAFDILDEGYDVVSIYDTCGTYKTDKLNGNNKFCPYFFCTKRELLMKYLDIEWAPLMPEYETLGLLTHKMLDDGIKPYEIKEDKDSIYFDGTKDKGKKLGYYHIRAGSTPAYLLTHKHFGDKKTYDDYIKTSPKREILRQLAWYYWMTEEQTKEREDVVKMMPDLGVDLVDWVDYSRKFIKFHGL